jgi:hypothetical protein
LNRESARKLSLVISLTISDLRGSSRGASANWRASLSSRRKSVSTVGLSEGKLLGGCPDRPSFSCILWIWSRTVPTCESSSAIASARGLPFCVAVYCRVNLAKCLFTIFKTSIYLLTSFRVNWIKRNWFFSAVRSPRTVVCLGNARCGSRRTNQRNSLASNGHAKGAQF